MLPAVRRYILPYRFGFPGWLAIGYVSGWVAPWATAAAIAIIVTPIARHPAGLVALWAGMATSYAAALATGAFRFLGESWEIAAVGAVVFAAGAYAAGTLLFGPFQSDAVASRESAVPPRL